MIYEYVFLLIIPLSIIQQFNFIELMNQVSIKAKKENLLRTKTKGYKEYIYIYTAISNNHNSESSPNHPYTILQAPYHHSHI